MKKISIKALFAGSIIYYLLYYLLLALPVIYVLLPLQTQEVGFERLGTVFLNAVEGSARLPFFQMLAGLIAALAAGYGAARIAGRNELPNGFLAAVPFCTLETYRLMSRPDGLVATIDYVLVAAALVCALLGGFLASLRSRKPAAAHQ